MNILFKYLYKNILLPYNLYYFNKLKLLILKYDNNY